MTCCDDATHGCQVSGADKPAAAAADFDRQEALSALLIAKKTIKAFHGPVVWDIYDRNAPEMREINAAIEALKS